MANQEFGVGLTMPMTIAIQNNQALDTQETLADIDKLTQIVKSIKGVKTVQSVTQPKGEMLSELYLQNQSQTLNSGLGDAMSGLDQINSGLTDAITQINGADYNQDSIDKLKSGADSLVSAVTQLDNGSQDVLSGLQSADSGSNKLTNGLDSVDTNLGKVQASLTQIQAYYTQLATAYGTIDAKLQTLEGSVKTLKSGMDGVVSMEGMLAKYPYDVNGDGTLESLASDPLFQKLYGTSQQLDAGLGQVYAGLGQLESGVATANATLTQVNAGLAQAQTGIGQIKTGTGTLLDGSKSLKSGLDELESGQQTLVSGLVSVETGTRTLRDGQTKLIDGISSLKGKMAELQSGLQDASKGVTNVSSGLSDASTYLNGLQSSNISESTFYITQDGINNADFQKSIKNYLSTDKKITEITVILDVDPYSSEGMTVARNVDQVFSAAIKTTGLKNATWGIGGVPQMNVDLETISDKSFTFARIVMIAAIFVVMLIITREFWMTLFVSMSLVASYFIAITLSGLIFSKVLGIGALSWNAPFFSFIMIVTLGVDYSIFLITRQKEMHELSPTQSLIDASARVGSVIASAGLILSGTFAAMYPSGVYTLMEIAVTVIIGILLLCLVFIPVFIPAMISLQTKVFKR